MPSKKNVKKDDGDEGHTNSLVKRVREYHRSAFSSGAMHREFEMHVTAAQNFFLKGDTSAAEKEATQALRIRPTAHLFALLAVIAESKGKFDRANDFRLLQAFLSRDIVLWEELLHEFMSQQLYFKSVVCLQRMSALEKDKTRYRALQLQLADLLVGLGEVRRASSVLVPLWNSSRCRDFEVFALLSSLYFQLGKWASLQRLIESSVKYAFRAPAERTAAEAPPTTKESTEFGNPTVTQGGELLSADSTLASSPQPTSSARVSKRVRFFGVEEQAENGNSATQENPSLPPAASLDEFSFDDVLSPSSASPASPTKLSGDTSSQGTPTPGGAIHQLYGERIYLPTNQSKKNFLTLVNVHAELLNEQGSFSETVQLLNMAAGCLEVDVLELPPDLLVRLGVAYGFLGGVWEQPCRDIFQHLVETCSMEDYGDVLLDAAVSLQKVGMHTEAAQLYTSLAHYHQFAYNRLHKDVGVAETELALMQDTASVAQVQAAIEALDLLRAEESDVKTVLAAANLGEAQCAYARGMYDEAKIYAERVLELDPTHLQARLLLGRYFFYQRNDTAAAVEILTARENEPALHRIQLGAFLVQIFQSAKRYVEAIALGVSIFEILLSNEEDGDTQSVAPGSSSRRSSSSLYLPTMTRASSAIIPASSLAGMVKGTAGSSVATRTSFSLAASIRASSSVARLQLSHRGLGSLTTTAYGASAAASVAAGWDKKEEEERLKDTSTIFQFTRRRRRTADKKASGTTSDTTLTTTAAGEERSDTNKEETKEETSAPKTAEERRKAILNMPPSDFWTVGEMDGDEEVKEDDAAESASKKAKVEKEEASQGVKTDEQTISALSSQSAKRAREDEDATPTSENSKSASAKGKISRRRAKKGDSDDGGRGVPSNYTTVNEKERDLEELEGFLTEAERIAASSEKREEGNTGDDPDGESKNATANEENASTETAAPDSFELPSLEEVSKQFNDPAMAQLFLEASSFTPGGGVRGGDGKDGTSDPWEVLAEANNNNSGGATVAPPLPSGTGPAEKVTLHEAIEALGKAGFMALAVAVVDCYSAVGKFTEAREFAFVSLMHFQQRVSLRQWGRRLGRPLRLAVLRAALAAGEGADAFRVGLRLLIEDSSEEKRHEVVELMHSVLNRCHDRSDVLYRAVADGYGDPAVFVLLASRYHQTRSYTRELNLFLLALKERPTDIFLNFMVGLSYLFTSHQKRARVREACVSAALYYLSRYQQLRLSLEPSSAAGEVIYNVARALHFLRLYYLCVPLYERVAYDLCVPTECTVALQQAARFNLYFIYRWSSGNRTLALTALQPCDSATNPVSGRRSPSPFHS